MRRDTKVREIDSVEREGHEIQKRPWKDAVVLVLIGLEIAMMNFLGQPGTDRG